MTLDTDDDDVHSVTSSLDFSSHWFVHYSQPAARTRITVFLCFTHNKPVNCDGAGAAVAMGCVSIRFTFVWRFSDVI